MSSFGLSGIFSGIDSDVLINRALGINSARLTQLTSKKAKLESEQSALKDMESTYRMLRDLADSLNEVNSLRRVTAATSDSGVAYAAMSAGATEGVYSIEVNRLASSEKEVHSGVTPTEAWTHITEVATADTEFLSADEISDAAGDSYQFLFQFGGEAQVTVDLSGYDATGITLNELVSEINTAAGYTAASAVDSGSGYKLRIQAQNAGGGNDLVITDSNSVALLDSTGDFSQTVDGDVGGDALVGAGNLVYTYNGVTRTITATADTSLSDLAALINNDNDNPGVTASIMRYDDPTGGEYHLVLTGANSGGDYGITVEAATTLAGFDAAEWTQTQSAQNSQYRVDGYPSGAWIESSGNTISDVLPNGTLHLSGVGTTTITLNRSTSTLKDSLSNLVGILGTLKEKMDAYAGYNETDGGGVLQGDYFVRSVYSMLRSAITSPGVGFDGDRDGLFMAAQIGIEVDSEGNFSFDESTFSQAVNDNYLGVLNLVGTDSTGTVSGTDIQFTSSDSTTEAGTYELEVDYDAGGAVTAARIRMDGETEWRSMTVDGNTLTGVYGESEQYMTLTVASGGASETRSYEVNVKRGFAGMLYERLEGILDSANGTLTKKLASYTNSRGTGSLDRIEDSIESEQSRLARLEERLVAQYARLEERLAQLDAQRGAFEALFSAIEVNTANKKDS